MHLDMIERKRTRGATAGWILTLAGVVAFGTLAFSILSTDYRRARFLSLLQGDSGVDGIGAQFWLLAGATMLVIGLGVGLIAVTSQRSRKIQ